MSSQYIFGKINIRIPLPPSYIREVWDYSKANTKNIQKAVKSFDWNKSFSILSVDGKVDLLNETLLNIFRNYIPNKKIKISYGQPPWMNDNIRNSLKIRSKLTKIYYKNGKGKEDKERLDARAAYCTEQILKAKNDYIVKMTNKLNDPKTAPKTYWSILSRFLHNKKIPAIPPLLINDKFISDCRTKANLFNNFFVSICTPIINGSTLPLFSFKTDFRINSFCASQDDITLIIKNLDSIKAHGCDNISVKMIQICGESIALPLKLIFETALKEKKFPDIWKIANVVPVHKKEEKNLLRNYRPISLLPIFSKIFERVIYNCLFNYFVTNKLFTPAQSGFLPGDSCIAQLLSIIHEIQTNFDTNPPADVRGVLLDISKAFGKVWHKGLIFKLNSYGVEGDLLSLLECYLTNRNQRVVLHGQTSDLKQFHSGVPQGSVLGPLLFLIYINDLPDGIMSMCKIFADDTSLFSIENSTHSSQSVLNSDLKCINEWAYQWKMHFNPDPKKQANEVIFSRKSDKSIYPPVTFNNNHVTNCSHQKHLGVVLDSKLDFNLHIEQKIKKCYKLIGIIRRLSVSLPRKALLTIYKSFVRPHLDYGDILYDKPGKQNFENKIERVQYKACIAITGAIQGSSKERLYDELGLISLKERRWYNKLIFFYKIVNGLLPKYLQSFLETYSQKTYSL